jgi:hypothetical protein
VSHLLTLSEVESYLRKCARAVGLEWGIAEEAGKAARWLAAFGLPGPECLLNHLLALRGQDYRQFIPDITVSPWRAGGGLLCPIVTGAAIADRSARLLDGAVIELGGTAYPLLLAATIGQAARFHDTAFTTRWDGVAITSFGHDLAISGDLAALLVEKIDAIECRHDPNAVPEQHASTLAYPIDEQIFERIDALAFETYAPATEASRAGAGAGLTDND